MIVYNLTDVNSDMFGGPAHIPVYMHRSVGPGGRIKVPNALVNDPYLIKLVSNKALAFNELPDWYLEAKGLKEPEAKPPAAKKAVPKAVPKPAPKPEKEEKAAPKKEEPKETPVPQEEKKPTVKKRKAKAKK